MLTRGAEFVIALFVLYESLEFMVANDFLGFPAGPASEYYPHPSNGLQLGTRQGFQERLI